MKKIACWLLILACIFAAGCWDRQELNNMAIVMAAGVDNSPDGIELTVQIARPMAFASGAERQGGQARENNVWVVSEKGRTVQEAQRMLEKKVSRHIYWSHNVILVLGEEAAKKGVRTVTNFFSRTPEIRETFWVFVTPGRAKDFLNSHSQLENTSAQATGNISRTGMGVAVMLKDLRIMLTTAGLSPVLPRVELTPSGTPQGVGEYENIKAAEEKEQQPPVVHAETTLTGTGAFKNDKLVGWLNLEETRGLLWLKDEMEVGSVTIPSPGDPGKYISVSIKRGETQIEPFYDGENIWFDVIIKTEGELAEQQSFEDITGPRTFKTIEKNISREIEARARSALAKAQFDLETDIFGFGRAFQMKYKREWPGIKDRWDEIFSDVEININASTVIKRTGLETKRALTE